MGLEHDPDFQIFWILTLWSLVGEKKILTVKSPSVSVKPVKLARFFSLFDLRACATRVPLTGPPKNDVVALFVTKSPRTLSDIIAYTPL